MNCEKSKLKFNNLTQYYKITKVPAESLQRSVHCTVLKNNALANRKGWQKGCQVRDRERKRKRRIR